MPVINCRQHTRAYGYTHTRGTVKTLQNRSGPTLNGHTQLTYGNKQTNKQTNTQSGKHGPDTTRTDTSNNRHTLATTASVYQSKRGP